MLHNKLNYSIVVRGGGREGENTWAVLVFYIWEFGVIKLMEDVLDQSISDDTGVVHH